MSAFTNWNGPEGSNIRASDLIELANAYTAIKTTLDQHILDQAGDDDNVHNVRDYVSSVVSKYVLTTDFSTALALCAKTTDLSAYATATALASGLAAKVDTTVLNNYATINALSTGLSTKADTTALNAYLQKDTAANTYTLKTDFATLNTNYEATASDVTTIKSKLSKLSGSDDTLTWLATLALAVLKCSDIQSSDANTLLKVLEVGNHKELQLGDASAYTKVQVASRLYLANNGTQSPYLTSTDITALDTIGMIAMWPKYEVDTEGKAVAKNVPDGYLACDGSTFDTTVYPDLYALLGVNTTPVIDYGIIKAKNLVSINTISGATSGSLADVVATIHETKVYSSVADLPSTAATGTLAIVYQNNTYTVYKKTDTGWEAQ